MKRRLFNAIAVVSAVLCVAVIVVWVRSYSRYEQATMVRWPNYYRLHLVNGRVMLEYTTDYPFPLGSGWSSSRTSAPVATIPDDTVPIDDREAIAHALDLEHGDFRSFSVFKFSWPYRYPGTARATQWRVFTVPYWSLLLLALLFPLAAGRRNLRGRLRARRGLCVTCGYDLRATPDRCPECGAILKKVEAR